MKNAWLGIGLMLVGLVSMLYFAAAVLGVLPEAIAAWPIPDRLRVGLGSALFGIAVTALGALIAIRQAALLRARSKRGEDAGRREPFIGPALD
jgi:hypothetical protein